MRIHQFMFILEKVSTDYCVSFPNQGLCSSQISAHVGPNAAFG